MAYTILVADHEQGVVDSIKACLEKEGYTVQEAVSGRDALDFLTQNKVDLALVGNQFPDVEGADVYEKMRQAGTQPMIMIETGNNLTVGHAFYADDSLMKPISEEELLSLVKAHLENRNTSAKDSGSDAGSGEILEIADLTMDKARRTCVFMGKPMRLTPKEFAILWKLAEAKGKVVKNSDMYQEIWGEEYYSENDNTIAVHIRRLRKKMEDAGVSDLSIQTVWSIGYKLSYSSTGDAAQTQKSSMLL